MWGARCETDPPVYSLGVNYNFALGHTATLYADPNIILDGKPRYSGCEDKEQHLASFFGILVLDNLI